ncbi:MAG: hypothetical protein JXA77_00515 [Bacteroidales bacterium]|nr:hypothetical protein [Bacteroidales bacterium]MBN2817656.1 hypothetical protein [Bacteroidales bacterium]
MGHGKETPRQKMIGMMYLVLMAMLALNVSNEVLNAFSVLDEGLISTKNTLEQTNKIVMTNFESEMVNKPEKTKPWFDLAKMVKDDADKIVELIEESKKEILKFAKEDIEAITAHGHINIQEINAKDNLDAPVNVMVGDLNDRLGKDIKNAMEKYREMILSQVLNERTNAETVESIEKSLETKNGVDHKSGEEVSWEVAHFAHLPLAGVLSIMTGLQINVRNAEAEALKYLYAKIDEGTFKFTNLDATVVPNSSYIIKGNEYKADVFLAAYDTSTKPTIYVTESRNPYDSVIENEVIIYKKNPNLTYTEVPANPLTGKAIYTAKASSLGDRYWGGIIEVVGPSGDIITKPFKRHYRIEEGSVVVSPTKMNVFYLGVDNPVDVSVAGVSPSDLSVTASNGTIVKRGNSYIMRPRRPGNSIISVSATVDGKKKQVGQSDFRVKKVPDPIAKVNGLPSGGINKNVLLAQVGVAADLENFDFDLTFTVTKFTVSTTIGGFLKEESTNSYKFSQAQKNLIQNLNKGQRLYIQDIEAVGPDGTPRPLPAISLLLN